MSPPSPATERIAVAEGRVVMSLKTLDLIVSGNAKKGDVLGIARVAGIMAAKRTSDLIPAVPSPRAIESHARYRHRPKAAGLHRPAPPSGSPARPG